MTVSARSRSRCIHEMIVMVGLSGIHGSCGKIIVLIVCLFAPMGINCVALRPHSACKDYNC